MTHRVGPKGQVVIPKEMRDQLGITPGADVVFTQTPEGVLVRPAAGLMSLRGTLAGVGGLTTELRRGKSEDAARERDRP